MTPDELAAIRASITHWEQNLAAETPKAASVSGTNCPLCTYAEENFPPSSEESACTICPVYKKTGHFQCFNSPYQDAATYYYLWRSALGTLHDRDLFRKYAALEIKFLQSLLPTES